MAFVNQVVPVRRIPKKRLTQALRNMQPSVGKAAVIDRDTCNALRVYARSHGWKISQQTQKNGTVHFWRIA